MKSGMTVADQILEILRDEIGSGVELKDKTIILNASGIDDCMARDLVMRIEDELDLLIPDKDAEKLITVKDIVDYVVKKKEGKKK